VCRSNAAENIFGCHSLAIFTLPDAILPVLRCLASELAHPRRPCFFCADRSLQATRLNGDTGGLVWDQNRPDEEHSPLILENIWHSGRSERTTITHFEGIKTATDYGEGKVIIETAHSNGQHIICGPTEHSHLVAGMVDGTYYVWDPDDSKEMCVEDNLNGNITVSGIFDDGYGGQEIEFWHYRVEYTTAPVALHFRDNE